jgi:TolB-like protein
MKRLWVGPLVSALLFSATALGQAKQVRIAVLDFTAAAPGELEGLGAGLQSMVTTDLVSAPNVVLVERARLKDIQAELKLAQTGAVDPATAAKIGELSGATHLIVGSFTVAGGKMRLDARMFVVGSGEVTLAEKMEGPQAQFFDLEKQLVGKIVDGIGWKPTKKQKQELQKPQTTNLDALNDYGKGLVAADSGKIDEAQADMKAALALDPNFALAQARLADFTRLLPAFQKIAEKALGAASQVCKPNSLLSPPCSQPGQQPSSAPATFNGSDGRTFGLHVQCGGEEVSCMTPCQLNLPAGSCELHVSGGANYTQTINVPGGPVGVVVSTKSNVNLVGGIILGGIAVAGTVIAIVMAEGLNSSSSSAQPYWPVPLSIATGAAFPAFQMLIHIGKNATKVVPLNHP